MHTSKVKIWLDSHRIEVFIFILALFVRTILFFVNFSHNEHRLIPTIRGDDGYYELSQNIINGNGFTFDTEEPFRPNPLRPPVWPYVIAFIANLFGSYWPVFLFEICIASIIPVLGFFIARRFLSESHSRWVGIALSLEPYSVLLSFLLYTETFFTFLFLIFLVCVFRYIELQTTRNAVWSGVSLGLATLVKPTVQFFPIIIPILLLFIFRKNLKKVMLRHIAIFLVVFSLLIAPWLYRNHEVFGAWGMSAQPVFNLYAYLAPTVLAIDAHTDISVQLRDFVAKDGFDANNITLSNSAIYKEKALEVIGNHKTALLKSVAITLVTFFTHDGMLTIFGYAGIHIENVLHQPALFLVAHPVELLKTLYTYSLSPAILILLLRIVWFVVTILFIYGAFKYLKRGQSKDLAILALVIILYFALTTALNGFGVNARFRVPVNALIFTFSIYGFSCIKERISLIISKQHA